MKKLIVYMPALNEAETIQKVIKSVPKSFDNFEKVEILVVNDGSTDHTEKEAIAAGATVLNHNSNKGVGVAFQTAVVYALKVNADVLVSIDADGQFDVNEIKDLIAPIDKNQADFSLGVRFNNDRPENMPAIKYWGNKQVNKIISFVSSTNIQDASCGFRAYSKDTLLSLNLHGSFTYTHEAILDLLNKGYKVAQIPVRVTYFDGRVSRVANNLVEYAVKTLKIIFKCLKDYKPLQFFLSIGFFILFIAILLGGFVFSHWLKSGTITPYKSLGFISLSLCGMFVIILTLALVSDSLNRIRLNQEKILYLLKKQHFGKD